MSDWERRVQELGLVAVIVLIALGVWGFVEWQKSQSQGTECIVLDADGQQVTRRGKRCALNNLF